MAHSKQVGPKGPLTPSTKTMLLVYQLHYGNCHTYFNDRQKNELKFIPKLRKLLFLIHFSIYYIRILEFFKFAYVSFNKQVNNGENFL